MKKTVLSLLMAIAVLPAFAQMSVGIIGGYNHSYLRGSDRYAGAYIDVLPPMPSLLKKYDSHWHAGVIADIHLIKSFYLQPQLLISTKGEKREYAVNLNTTVRQINLIYLELPVNLLYKFPVGNGKLLAGAGGYAARALSGKYIHVRNNPSSGTERESGKIVLDKKPSPEPGNGEKSYHYKKYDAGLNFIAGYECKNGLLFNVNYSYGLTDVFNYANDNFLPTFKKNTYFGISAGYLFKLK